MKTLIILLLLISGVVLGQTAIKAPIARTLEYRSTEPKPVANPWPTDSIATLTGWRINKGVTTPDLGTAGHILNIPNGGAFGWSAIERLTITGEKNPTDGEIKILDKPIRTPKKVAVSDGGLLRIIDAFYVITSQKYKERKTTVFASGDIATPRALLGTITFPDGAWHTHASHYEDKDGNVLTEVYLLMKL